MATTTTTVTGQQSIPTELMPYFTGTGTAGQAGYVPGLLPKAQEVYSKDYASTYAPLISSGLTGAGGVASLSPMQQQVGQQLNQLGSPVQFQAGLGAAGAGYNMLGSEMPSMTQQGTMFSYMSPYAQNVIDVNKQEAFRDYEKGLPQLNAQAVRQGAFGGSRSAIERAEANRNLQTNLGQIQARGMQSAFEAAQRGLEAERTSRLQQGTALGQLGQTFGQLGIAQQSADIDRLKTMGAYGDSERAYQQQLLDAQKADLTTQSEFGQQQLGGMANILRGVPTTNSTSTQATTAPPPSFASQLAGMGLTGLSLYNMFGNK